MKKIAFILFMIPFLVQANTNYIEGDGSLNLNCRDKNKSARLYNTFTLVLMYNSSAAEEDLDLTLDGLASGNSSTVYQVLVQQFPSYDNNMFPLAEKVPGCEYAPLSITTDDAQINFLLSFTCANDGAAGSGEIILNTETRKIEGTVTFPEGSDVSYPIEKDTKIDVTCDFESARG